MKVSETTYPSGVIKAKAMKDDKGREGVIKLEKWANVVYGWPLTRLVIGVRCDLFCPDIVQNGRR